MIVGIDYSTYEAVICAVPFDGGKPKLAHAKFRRPRDSGDDAMLAALSAVTPAIRDAAAELGLFQYVSGVGTPHVFWIERGFGQSRKADFALGCYFGAIWVALERVNIDRRSAINPLDLREWKRIVTGVAGIGVTKAGAGNGNAKKEVANEACRALLLLEEVDGTDWTADELDAYGIAFAGRRLNAKAVAA